MELRPRLPYQNDEELEQWMDLIDQAKTLGPKALIVQTEQNGDLITSSIRTVEDLLEYHQISENFIGVPIESTYWTVAMKIDDEVVTTPNHRLKIKIVPKPPELLRFKEFAEEFEKYIPSKQEGREGNVFIADIHAGGIGRGYDMASIAKIFATCAEEINGCHYDQVNICLLGDLVESVSGLSHLDTWKNIEMHGPELIKETSKIVSTFLRSVNNLGTVRIVGGNHDRLPANKNEDNSGGAANLIGYILEVMGFEVKFDSNYLVYDSDGIRYILEHGDKGLSKQDPYEKIFRLGSQTMFNFILQGHDHARKTKRSPDGLNYRQITVPSLVPNNAFADTLGREGTSGMTIIESKKGKPRVTDYTL